MSRINKGMDPIHIAQSVYDADLEAQRVYMLPTELEMELNADDGDSVLALRQMQVVDAQADVLIDSSKATRMTVTETCEVKMAVADVEISLGSLNPGQILEICSPQIKVSVSCKVILQS